MSRRHRKRSQRLRGTLPRVVYPTGSFAAPKDWPSPLPDDVSAVIICIDSPGGIWAAGSVGIFQAETRRTGRARVTLVREAMYLPASQNGADIGNV